MAIRMEIREGQILMLCEDMEREYSAGNYVICGGDFNHDLKALADDNMERESWAYPFPRKNFRSILSFASICCVVRSARNYGIAPEMRTWNMCLI